jgi:flagellin
MSISIRYNPIAANAAANLKSHYAELSRSVRRVSSGLRVGTAADDAAGLAIRELMRADVAALHQGMRNANDAISMIQTADGALGIIDEKLIRMMELAEQAATGTYNSDQRLMINSEFQAMASEIERIARATEFNGIKLLDGSLSGTHDGSNLASTGAAKIHFGSGNDPAEDYYYITVGDATLYGLGLAESVPGSGGTGGGGSTPPPGGIAGLVNGGPMVRLPPGNPLGAITYSMIIPAGTQNLSIHMNDRGANNTLQLFTLDGIQLAGTTVRAPPAPYGAQYWDWFLIGISTDAQINTVLTPANGFLSGASYDKSLLNGTGGDIPDGNLTPGTAGNHFSYNGMNFGYSGDVQGLINLTPLYTHEYLTIDSVTEDLVLLIVGGDDFAIQASWGATSGGGGGGSTYQAIATGTQQLAQESLDRLRDAIVSKDTIRAHLGATQNRLENTISNLAIQAENIQAAESRISDADISLEMTKFARNQVLTQSAISMLAQANVLPRMALQLLDTKV